MLSSLAHIGVALYLTSGGEQLTPTWGVVLIVRKQWLIGHFSTPTPLYVSFTVINYGVFIVRQLGQLPPSVLIRCINFLRKRLLVLAAPEMTLRFALPLYGPLKSMMRTTDNRPTFYSKDGHYAFSYGVKLRGPHTWTLGSIRHCHAYALIQKLGGVSRSLLFYRNTEGHVRSQLD